MGRGSILYLASALERDTTLFLNFPSNQVPPEKVQYQLLTFCMGVILPNLSL